MAFVLFLLFVLVPILEISVIIQVGSVLGAIPTIGLMIISAMVGASLVRSQGIATMFSVRQKLSMGEMPSTEIVEGLLLLVAGVLLVTPGFVTDVVGILILTAPVRKMMALGLIKRFQFQVVNAATGHAGGFHQYGGGFGHQQGPSHGQSHQQSQNHAHSQAENVHPADREEPAAPRQGHTIDGEYERKD
ncbi:FxsA family protein [Corallincola platygyrae]|uniref:FxsA family protein n=1 Tax=Corallincola platygyrae TaxID=1193278 RepID=A0ABW4XQ82_9GAMM